MQRVSKYLSLLEEEWTRERERLISRGPKKFMGYEGVELYRLTKKCDR